MQPLSDFYASLRTPRKLLESLASSYFTSLDHRYGSVLSRNRLGVVGIFQKGSDARASDEHWVQQPNDHYFSISLGFFQTTCLHRSCSQNFQDHKSDRFPGWSSCTWVTSSESQPAPSLGFSPIQKVSLFIFVQFSI